MAVYKCELLCNNPRLVHDRAFRRITRYLASTSTYVNLMESYRWLYTNGIVYNMDKVKGVNCYVDAKFSRGWSQANDNNAEHVMLYLVYVFLYAGRPILRCSRLQTELSLNTLEKEYIVLIQGMRDIVTFILLMKEILFIFDINLPKIEIYCNVFEDNQICMVVTHPKKSLRTKHININDRCL